jgi:hypothetical protein
MSKLIKVLKVKWLVEFQFFETYWGSDLPHQEASIYSLSFSVTLSARGRKMIDVLSKCQFLFLSYRLSLASSLTIFRL